MLQQGQVFELATRGRDGERMWAYRYRAGGRDSKRVQRGGFRSEADARAALERALEKLRRESGMGRRPTLAEFVDEYLAQHEVSPVTLEKPRFLLTRAVRAFGDFRGCDLMVPDHANALADRLEAVLAQRLPSTRIRAAMPVSAAGPQPEQVTPGRRAPPGVHALLGSRSFIACGVRAAHALRPPPRATASMQVRAGARSAWQAPRS
jgi:hypothetical protein